MKEGLEPIFAYKKFVCLKYLALKNCRKGICKLDDSPSLFGCNGLVEG